MLVAIVKKRLTLEASLHEILQVLSLAQFEQVPILQAFRDSESRDKTGEPPNQLNLPNL